MRQYIEVEWTCGSEKEAQDIVHALLRRRLIACANLMFPMHSFFVWKGKIESEREVKVLMKTAEENFDKISEYIEEHAAYDVPAILALPILHGNRRYLDWLSQETENNYSGKN